MTFLQRAAVPTCAAALALGLLGAAAAPPRARCLADALDQWFCPSEPRGVAVLDNLGSVVCAAGSCVEFEDEWHCSATAGGRAELTAEEPVCEGGCRSPRAADCKRM